MASKKTISGVARPKSTVSHTPVQKPQHGSVKPSSQAIKLVGGRTPSKPGPHNYPSVPDAVGKLSKKAK